MIEKSLNQDIYWTIKEQKEAEITILKSKFIAEAYPVTSRNQADGILDVVRHKYHDASHHCFAWTTGQTGLEYRFSDDGEPTGSAGKPIFFIINKYDVKDIIVIVTRYFGGKKLGVGGLSRAYSEAADEVLKICEKKSVHITKTIKTFCTYEDIQIVKKLLEKYSIRNEEEYKDSIEIISDIPLSLVDEYQSILISNTKGRAGSIIMTVE
jgi:uncharacterized YigZ family protein